MAARTGWVESGAAVRIRGERWRVVRVAAHGECAVAEVAGAGASNRGTVARFILPFDTAVRLPRANERPRVVRPAAWRRAARAALAGAAPGWASLRAAAAADVALLPFQLEPALAMTRGLACRFLLADEVGLGKTIQAGLMVAELLAREPDARVLVLTPAGLRDQWRDELRERFRIEAAIVDAAALARAAAALPAGVNPWSVAPVAIASIDFVKRPEVIRALEPIVWDLAAFDEAHGLAGRSDRAAAADLVARRARRVVAITATPHAGDDTAFDRLLSLGRLQEDESVVMFRRSRAGAGLRASRSLRFVRVRPSPEEAAMHRALEAYARAVARGAPAGDTAGARLAMIVLARRACSSAASLARSAARRMALLDEPPDAAGAQLRLPIEDAGTAEDEEPQIELAAPGLEDPRAERRWLERIATLAGAVTRESKIDAAVRLLRRANEPAIVFTQYRDTLEHLASVMTAGDTPPALLHGGLTARERTDEARRFTHGNAPLLLATDAASEGLNLHRRCRLVVSLDIPWTPLRLEQRIGRVDRIGQRRRVHAVALVARGTSDAGVARTLRARASAASDRAPFDREGRLRSDAVSEAMRLGAVRDMRRRERPHRDGGRPVVTVLRRRSGALLYLPLRVHFVDADAGAIWDAIVAPVLPCAGEPPFDGPALRAWISGTVGRHAAALAAGAAQAHGAVLERLRAELEASVEPLARRERAIAAALRAHGGRLAAPLVQPGLFDRRALRDAEAQRRLADEAIARADARLAELSRTRLPFMGERRLVFAVVL